MLEFHEVDLGEEDNLGKVIGTSNSKECVQPLLGQGGALGRQHVQEDSKVVQSLFLQLIVET